MRPRYIIRWLGRVGLELMCGRIGRWSPARQERFARLLARLLWRFQKHRRPLMIQRMRQVLDPSLTDAQLHEIQHAAYINMGRTLAEFMRLRSMSSQEVAAAIRLEDEHILQQAIDAGKGVIVLTAHFGNWELLGARISQMGERGRFHVVAAPQRDNRLTRLLDSVRNAHDVDVIARGDAARVVLKSLRNGEVVGILLDIDMKDQGIVVDFMGLPASTTEGPAAFALRTGAAVVPVFDYRIEAGVHVAKVGNPVELVKTGQRVEDLRVNTERFSAIVADHVRCRPDLWIWVPDRWRSTSP